MLATKFSFHGEESANPNAGGNGRKNMHRALEGSLRRLRTDYVDLYWMHVWDKVTPVEEVLQSLGDLVRAGAIRYFRLSDVPAWYAARAATLAAVHGVAGPIALQLEYSLTERAIEREHVPAALELGLGITPWSPLSAGFLAGKYHRAAGGTVTSNGGRLVHEGSPFASKFTDRNWGVQDAVREVATEIGRPPAQVALAWIAAQPAVTSLILGASTLDQLHVNLGALDLELSSHQLAKLDLGSRIGLAHPYNIFTDKMNRAIFGGTSVKGWR